MGRAIQGEGPTSSGHRDRVLGAEATRPPGSLWAQPYKGALALGQEPCRQKPSREHRPQELLSPLRLIFMQFWPWLGDCELFSVRRGWISELERGAGVRWGSR